MTTEIFISYRRSDAIGHARNVHRELLQSFEPQRVFFDLGTLESGDVFPTKIDDAVRSCKVLLALIGPGWAAVEHQGRRRLEDPADFVRREIALAIELGKHIVPVLIDDAAMPAAADLPTVLAALAGRDAHTLRGKSVAYDDELRRLVDLMTRFGASRLRRASAGQPHAEREMLPVLCDRGPQDTAAGDLIRAETRAALPRPIVLVVHGRPDEAHKEFVDRVQTFSLPRLLKGTSFASGIQFAHVNDLLPVDAGQAAFDQRLRERLGEALDLDTVESDAQLLRQMQALKLTTLVAVVTWRASELAGDPMLMLRRVFDYWAQFPAPGARALAGCIVCLKYDRAAASSGWVRRMFGGGSDRIEAMRTAIDRSVTAYARDERVAWCVAEELPSVTVADLDRWVLEVARLVGRFTVAEDKLQSIIGGPARPMQAVLPELGKLINAL